MYYKIETEILPIDGCPEPYHKDKKQRVSELESGGREEGV
jgi:hypothetical protein